MGKIKPEGLYCRKCGKEITPAQVNSMFKGEPHCNLKRLEFEVSYLVSGHVESVLRITSPEYQTKTPEEIVQLLNDGELLTTIQEGGEVLVTETGEKIGEVDSIDNFCEYTDFELYNVYKPEDL